MNDIDHKRYDQAMNARKTYQKFADVVDLVCCVSGVEVWRLAGRCRAAQVVAARRAVAVLLRGLPRRHLGAVVPSFPEIAAMLGSPNHSLVISQYKSVYADFAAHEVVDMVCEEYGVPASERPAWLWLMPLDMRTPVARNIPTEGECPSH